MVDPKEKVAIMQKRTPTLAWTNYDNGAFYENLRVEGLESFAREGGIASGPDVKQLKSYWLKAKSILEVGAGYGRVIKILLENHCQAQITAIERCKNFYHYLYKYYGHQVRLFNYDMHHINQLEEQFDLILWLWSGIADFSPSEQIHVLSQLKALLADGGNLVIDIMPENIIPLKTNIKQSHDKQFYVVQIKDMSIYTYQPTDMEIKCYASLLGFKNVKRNIYRTDIGRERWQYILS